MKLKTFAILFLVCCLSCGVVLLAFTCEKSGTLSRFKTQFENCGLTVTEVKSANGNVCFSFESMNDTLTEEDILLFRYILETAEDLHFHPQWEIALENKDKTRLCEIRFSEFGGNNASLENKKTPSEKDPNLLAFELRSDLAHTDYSCTGVKVTSYPEIYIETNLPQRKEVSVNIRITTSLSDENSLAAIHRAVADSVKIQNTDGGGIAQYNLSIVNEEGKILYLSSTDLLRNNILRLI